MKRDYKLYLTDIGESIRDIENYTQGISEEQFKNNKMMQDAVIRKLEIIGEASKNIPSSLKEKNKQIPWFTISHFRDLMIHSYFEVRLGKIWSTIKDVIPIIKQGLRNISLV